MYERLIRHRFATVRDVKFSMAQSKNRPDPIPFVWRCRVVNRWDLIVVVVEFFVRKICDAKPYVKRLSFRIERWHRIYSYTHPLNTFLGEFSIIVIYFDRCGIRNVLEFWRRSQIVCVKVGHFRSLPNRSSVAYDGWCTFMGVCYFFSSAARTILILKKNELKTKGTLYGYLVYKNGAGK